MKKIILLSLILILASPILFAQISEGSLLKEDKGEFSGNFQTNNQFYVRDDRIGATTTQYLK